LKVLNRSLISFSLDGLFSALRIEDEHSSSKNQKTDFQAKALTVEDFHKSIPNKSKKNGPKRIFNTRGNKSNYNKIEGCNQGRRQCRVCGGANHIAKNCYFHHGQNRKPNKGQLPPKPQANVVTVVAISNSPTNRHFVDSPELNSVFNLND